MKIIRVKYLLRIFKVSLSHLTNYNVSSIYYQDLELRFSVNPSLGYEKGQSRHDFPVPPNTLLQPFPGPPSRSYSRDNQTFGVPLSRE